MRSLNRQINLFVAVQIACSIGWIIVWNTAEIIFSPLRPLAEGVHFLVALTGLTGAALDFVALVIVGVGILSAIVGTFAWLMMGDYRRGIGIMALVMGVGMLFGGFVRHMRPVSELEPFGFFLLARLVLTVVLYFGLAVALSSRMLEWIAAKELRDASVKVRFTHSIPLCTILPIAHLGMGYVETLRDQLLVFAIGSIILVAFTAWTNRQRSAVGMLRAPYAHRSDPRGRLRDRRSEYPPFRF